MCIKFKFFVTEKIDIPYIDTIVHVNVSGHVCHEKERHRRNICGKTRVALADELEKRSAIVVELKMLAKADKEIQAGNLNKTPSLDILQKISSENRAKHDLDKDFVTFMIKLYDQQQEQIRGEVLDGYIQEFSLIPFSVILFSEK